MNTLPLRTVCCVVSRLVAAFDKTLFRLSSFLSAYFFYIRPRSGFMPVHPAYEAVIVSGSFRILNSVRFGIFILLPIFLVFAFFLSPFHHSFTEVSMSLRILPCLPLDSACCLAFQPSNSPRARMRLAWSWDSCLPPVRAVVSRIGSSYQI